MAGNGGDVKSEGAQLRTLYARELIRTFMERHLGCTPKEIAFATGISEDRVRRAVRAIRGEWTTGSRRFDMEKVIDAGLARVREGQLIGAK